MYQKMSLTMIEITKQCKNSTSLPYVYGKKDLDLLDILFLACSYVPLIYKFMYIIKNFVFTVGSGSDRSSVKCCGIFRKCQNPESSKLLYLESILVIVQETWFNMFSFGILLYFTFLPSIWQIKSVPKTPF